VWTESGSVGEANAPSWRGAHGGCCGDGATTSMSACVSWRGAGGGRSGDGGSEPAPASPPKPATRTLFA